MDRLEPADSRDGAGLQRCATARNQNIERVPPKNVDLGRHEHGGTETEAVSYFEGVDPGQRRHQSPSEMALHGDLVTLNVEAGQCGSAGDGCNLPVSTLNGELMHLAWR